MALSVKLSKKIMRDAQIASKIMDRTVSEQIEYWVKIGKIVEENPIYHTNSLKASSLLGKNPARIADNPSLFLIVI